MTLNILKPPENIRQQQIFRCIGCQKPLNDGLWAPGKHKIPQNTFVFKVCYLYLLAAECQRGKKVGFPECLHSAPVIVNYSVSRCHCPLGIVILLVNKPVGSVCVIKSIINLIRNLRGQKIIMDME